MLSSLRNMASHVVYTVPVISILLLAACGDPAAPYEGVEKSPRASTMPEVTSATEAVKNAEITTIDLQTMEEAEFEQIIPAGPRCSFAYTSESQPVFAASMGSEGAVGAISVHGKLVRVMAGEVNTFAMLTRGGTFTANGLQVKVMPDSDDGVERNEDQRRQPANVIFELEQGLKVGYRGWYVCRGENTAS